MGKLIIFIIFLLIIRLIIQIIRFINLKDYDRLKIINRILIESFPILYDKGFVKTPFKKDYFGMCYPGCFEYTFYKLFNDEVAILQLETYFKVNGIIAKLQIYKLATKVESLDDLKNFYTEYSVWSSKLLDYDLINPFSNIFRHKRLDLTDGILPYKSKFKINRLRKNIKTTFNNLDKLIERWHKLQVPYLVDLEGNFLPDQPVGTKPIPGPRPYHDPDHKETVRKENERKINAKRLFLLNKVITDEFALIESKGFQKSPFKKDKFGKIGSYKYSYTFYKLQNDLLICLTLWAKFREPFINADLNIFRFENAPKKLSDLKDFKITDYSATERLDGDKLSIVPPNMERYPNRYLSAAAFLYKWQELIIGFILKLKLDWVIRRINIKIKRWLQHHNPPTINQKGEVLRN